MTKEQYLDLKEILERLQNKLDLHMAMHQQDVDAIARQAVEELYLPEHFPHPHDP